MEELVAQEGFWLTQKTLRNNEQRGFWKRLYPAVSLTTDDFEEWTDEQKEAWDAEHPMEEVEQANNE